MEKQKPLMIVADDAGLRTAIGDGIRMAAESNALTHADFMVLEPEAVNSALVLQREHPEIGIGLHIVTAGMADTYHGAINSYICRFMPDRTFRTQVTDATRKQIMIFQQKIGASPSHISSHGHIHMDLYNQPFPWFIDLIYELFEGTQEMVVVRGIQTHPIRHTRLRDVLLGRQPLTPQEFGVMLSNLKVAENQAVEWMVHPASISGEAKSLNSIHSLAIRQQDLQALIAIVQSGVIDKVGYQLEYPPSR